MAYHIILEVLIVSINSLGTLTEVLLFIAEHQPCTIDEIHSFITTKRDISERNLMRYIEVLVEYKIVAKEELRDEHGRFKAKKLKISDGFKTKILSSGG